jgi:hypothetical protein
VETPGSFNISEECTMRQKYQVRNITRKPKPLQGPDTRTVIEKRGHYVSYRNAQDKVIMLRPDEVKIINEPTEDILTLVSQGYLSCAPMRDITDALHNHKAQPRKKKGDHEAEVAAEIETAAAMGQRARQARASMMGETKNEKGVTELEGAVNPDGANNFTVTANRNSIPKRQRQR